MIVPAAQILCEKQKLALNLRILRTEYANSWFLRKPCLSPVPWLTDIPILI